MSEGTPGRAFDETASTYAAVRPGYPGPALDWLLPAGARRVLDLGAGTGKLTRQLVERGLDVAAVEPSPQMGAELAAAVPEARLLPGTAEAIPLPAADVNAVLVGSAFHWFDHGPALAEIRRVLRRGGTLGLIRNRPDDAVAWVAELDALTEARAHRGTRRPVPPDPPGFEDVATAEFAHRHPVTRESLLALLQTFGYYLRLDRSARADLLAAVGRLVDTHPELAGLVDFELPFVTRCWRARRP
ncbi:class I SAM-dependent methyltransferase [soil metagenome]